MGNKGKYIIRIIIFHGMQIAANMLGLIFRGMPGPTIHSILIVVNFMEFASGYILVYQMTHYIIACLDGVGDLRRWKRMAMLFCGVSILFLIISQFTELYYFIDAQNYYHRTKLFPLSLIFGACAVVMNFALVIRYHRALSRIVVTAIGTYLILPAIALALQSFIYGVYLLQIADTIALGIMFFLMFYVQVQQYCERDRQLTEMQIRIMLSQIQPHFPYNSLTVIDQLCKTDPPLARRALASFSTYLRCDLQSLDQKGLIPFSEELRHIDAYLALEQLRFGECLEVRRDIQTEDFLLPSLTVQPLVENAVKHGLGNKTKGGAVTIATTEQKDCYYVTITDDGVGFTPGEYKGEGTHMAIKNIRNRLKMVCDGELTIESTPGHGTRAMVTIHKEGKHHENIGR